ncbi:MAG TPA: methyl-accepting chemotaxis protein [Noviherbaspirillum sp.]|nr:methyl-accepting chemotaxis protein [Noviherbaspirillum sp.]
MASTNADARHGQDLGMLRGLRISTSLTVVLVLFVAFMTISNFVAWNGVRDTADSVQRLSAVTGEVQAVNGAFAATQRARVSLAGTQSAARAGNEEVAKDLMKTVGTRLEQGQKLIDTFAKMHRKDLEDQELAKKLVSTYEALNESVRAEQKAVVAGDTAAYDRISSVQSIAASRVFNTELEKFSKRATARGDEAEAGAGNTFTRLQVVIVTSMVLALLVAVLARWALSHIVQQPLQEIGEHLNRLARGDLTARIDWNSSTEIGTLFEATKRVQQNLTQVIGTVHTSAESVSAASKQIATGNADLSARTESQASSLEETASSMEELTSTVKQNADNARQANQLAATASEVAVKGGQVVSQVVETMGSINESAKKIVDIISVIDGIAFQTNILALNAAVEAARAGEQGRGFAVVAAEVRNLAQRSASAAKEIKKLINDSVGKVDTGSKLVDHAGTTMGEIVQSIQRVTDIMAEITAASAEQGAGIEQVNQAIAEMDNATQQNAALVEEAAAAAQSMQDQAEKLVQAVNVFKLDNVAHSMTNPVARQSTKVAVVPVTRKIASAKVAAPAGALPAAAAARSDQWEEF